MTHLAIHGGAGALPRAEMNPERAEEFHAALHAALVEGHRALVAGKSSLDAVEAAVTWLEDCPLFNAGRGSAYNREGQVEMEATIMDGATLQAGSALLLKHVRNPIQLARRVMARTPHIALGGEAAERFAAQEGLRLEEAEYFFTTYRWEAMQRVRGTNLTPLSEDTVVKVDPAGPEAAGTVGAVALDARGNLASSISSGGTTNKFSGRVGQAAIVGSGAYAKNATCAVSCTGQGEAFMRGVIAYDVSAQMEYAGAELGRAATNAINQRLPGRGGLIALDRKGNVALPFNTEGMYRGWIDAGGIAHTAIYESVRDWPAPF